MTSQKVALIGAGAIGSYFIWGFDGIESVDFSVIAEGDRGRRLERSGARINGEVYPLRVKTPTQAGPQDLVLIATKYSALEEAARMLPALTGPDTLVLSLLNGVDSEEQLARAVGWEHIIPAMIRIASRRTQEGVSFDPTNALGVYFGLPADRANEAGKLQKLEKLFSRTGIHFHISEDILKDMWFKYASNIVNNLPQAVLGISGKLYGSEHGLFLAQKLWSETAAVAAARGVTLGEQVQIFPGAGRGEKYSTLQDLEAGRHTEIDMLAGQLIRMAEAEGIQVPYCTYTYHAVKALEERNDGRFD